MIEFGTSNLLITLANYSFATCLVGVPVLLLYMKNTIKTKWIAVVTNFVLVYGLLNLLTQFKYHLTQSDLHDFDINLDGIINADELTTSSAALLAQSELYQQDTILAAVLGLPFAFAHSMVFLMVIYYLIYRSSRRLKQRKVKGERASNGSEQS